MPTAYVLINCESGSEPMIIEELKRLPQVVEAYRVDSSYDMIAKFTADTSDTVKEVIALEIRGFE